MNIDDGKIDMELLELVNQARKEHSLTPLIGHPALRTSALQQAQDMAQHNRCSHYGFGSNSTWAERIAAAGYPGATLDTTDEVVAGGQNSAAQAFKDWMGSLGHAAKILNPEARHMGAAAVAGSGGWTYWCIDFAWGAPDPDPTPTPDPALDYMLI